MTHEVLDKQGWGCPVGDIIANIMTKKCEKMIRYSYSKKRFIG